MPKIRGRIIRILDTRTAIINLGKKDGIAQNSIFQILGEPESIVDPFTDEVLGQVTVVKTKLRASQVNERFTIATTKWLVINTKPGKEITDVFRPFANLYEYETEVVDQGEMRVAMEDIQPWKAQSEIPVRLGDEVEVEISVLATAKKEAISSAKVNEVENNDTDSSGEEQERPTTE